MQYKILTIAGMTCGGCVNSVTRVLKDLPGVHQVDVTLIPSQARIAFEETQVNIETLTRAIQEAGFEVTGARQGSSS